MLKQGLLKEVKKLRNQGISWKRIQELGFEYAYAAAHLRGELSKDEMKQNIQKATEDFVRRQMSWFKKDQRIRWVKNYAQASSLTKTFLSHP